MTTTLLIVFPCSQPATLGSLAAVSRISASSALAATCTSPRSLPLTCTAIWYASSTTSAGSASGQCRRVNSSLRPSSRHNSSAMCGANGESSCTRISRHSRNEAASPLQSDAAFDSSISEEIAVLNWSRSSCWVTRRIVLCVRRRSSSTAPFALAPAIFGRLAWTSRQTRLRKRCCPCTCSSDQSTSFSAGAAKRMNKRAVSAPNSSMISRGETTLPLLLDIFSPSRPLTIPWVTSFWAGSSMSQSPSSCITLVQKRK